MLFQTSSASFFGSSSGSWGRARPSEQQQQQQQTPVATAEPVHESLPRGPQAHQYSPYSGRHFPPQAHSEDTSRTGGMYPPMSHPSDPLAETMEDRHYYPQRYSSGYHRHCGWSSRHHEKDRKLAQANKVAELISNRNFEGQIAHPFGRSETTYGLLLGGATFLALTGLASVTGLRPRLGSLLGSSRMARLTLTAAAGVAAGSVSFRYQVQHQTLNDLKVVGTYMTPSEPSASADALCQHPIVVQALMEREKEQERERLHRQFLRQHQRAGQQQQHVDRYGPPRRWEDHRMPTIGGHGGSTKRQILTELDHVLDHFEERRALLLQAKAGEPAVAEIPRNAVPEQQQQQQQTRSRRWSR